MKYHLMPLLKEILELQEKMELLNILLGVKRINEKEEAAG